MSDSLGSGKVRRLRGDKASWVCLRGGRDYSEETAKLIDVE